MGVTHPWLSLVFIIFVFFGRPKFREREMRKGKKTQELDVKRERRLKRYIKRKGEIVEERR